MSIFQLRPNHPALVQCAPITDKPGSPRAMRVAIERARKGKEAGGLQQQQAFDTAMTTLVRAIPADAPVARSFASGNLMASGRRSWKRIVRNPAVIAILLALAVIGGVFG